MAQGISSDEDLRKYRIREALKGKPKSDAHKKKLSESRQGKYLRELNPNYKKGRPLKNCIICGDEFLGNYPSKVKGLNKYCSRTCLGVARSLNTGKNHPRYKDGTYSYGKRYSRNVSAHRKFRITVLERDKYTCTLCGDRYREMHVDHIIPFKDDPSLRYEPSNGRVLCKSCHYEITFGKSPLNNWEAYSRWAMVTRGKPGTRKPVAAAETKRGDK